MIYGILPDRRIHDLEQQLTDARTALTHARRDARQQAVRADEAEARIQAVEDILTEWAAIDPEKFNTDDALGILDDIRRALEDDA